MEQCSLCLCVVYLQSSISLLDALAEFLKQRVSLLFWIIQQLTVVLVEDRKKASVCTVLCVFCVLTGLEVAWSKGRTEAELS